ncbi:E3 ubiquitin-protein ligase listerin isoform X2 [Daktulosphaira vitifoliae]|nr:E3 ubiquitin-protein ligase listerin isoform X2 [Daktulosphaira vitifoliae]
MQIRTATSCLYATSTYLNALPKEQIENIECDLKSSFLRNCTFWKLNKHLTPSVRQAWFTLLYSILDKLQYFLQDEYKKVAFAVFDNVDEDNVTVSLMIWKNIQLIFSKPELNIYWIRSNAEKIFLPKLWKVLSCSKGCISSAYANILNMCKNNPSITTIPMTEFYLKCITSMISGLEKMSARFDRTNFVAGVETLFDYVIHYLRNNYQEKLFCECIITEVINLIKFCLTGKLAKAMTPPVISHLTLLLEVLIIDDALTNLKQIIWNSLKNLLITDLDKEIILENIQNQLHVHFIVLSHLKSPEIKIKKNLKVTFEESTKDTYQPAKLCLNDSYYDDLVDFLSTHLYFYFEKSSNTEFGYLYANHICQVVSAFKNFGVIQKLTNTLVILNNPIDSPFKIYEWFVKKWLGSEYITTYNLLSLVIVLLENIKNYNEQAVIIDDVTIKFGSNVVLEEIMRYISDGHSLPEVICKWLETKPLQNEYKIFISNENLEENKTILFVNCLKIKENRICVMWTKILMETVCKNPSPSLIIILRQIFEKNLNDKSFIDSHLELIFDTFECLIQTYFEKSLDCESKSLHELNQTWKLLLNHILDTYNTEVVKRCCSVILNYVKTSEINLEHVESAVDQFIDEVLSCTKCEEVSFKLFFELFKDMKINNYDKITDCCEIVSYIDGSFLYVGSNKETTYINEECFSKVYSLYSHTYVSSKLIMKFFDATEHFSNFVNNINEELVQVITNIIFNLNVVMDIMNYFSSRKYCYHLKNNIVEDTRTIVADIVQSQPKHIALNVINKIIEKIISERFYWSKPLASILEVLSLPQDELINIYKTALIQYSDCTNMIYIIQVFVCLCGIKNLEFDHLPLSYTRCVWNVHFKHAVLNEELISQYEKVLMAEEKILAYDVEFFTDNKKLLEALRHVECLNIIYERSSSFIKLKYSKLVFNHLNTWIQVLTSVDISSVSFLPVGILITIVGSLYSNVMKFYNQEFYKDVDQNNDTVIKFKSDTNILHENLIKIWINLSGKYEDDITHQLVLETLSSVIEHVEFDNIDEKNLFSLCSDLICSDCYYIEVTAYKILEKICEYHKVSVDSEDDSDQIPFVLSVLPLKRLQDLVTCTLNDIKFGSTYEPQPFTENFKNTRVYLLLWNVIFKLCSKLESQERYKYTSHLNDKNAISCLTENLLKLMPQSIIKTYANNDVNPIIKGLFNTPPSFSSKDYWDNKKLWHLVCWTYYSLLHTLPAVVRKWWVDSEHKVSTLVDKLTTKYVSQSLILQEFQDIKQAKKIDNIVVTLYENRGILVVSYIIEETAVDITIQMASNHPLGLIRVSSDKSMINMSQWKVWLKQLALFFSHQNGSIIDGISLWQLNITKKFDGVEECYICYSILHNSNYQLPKSACRTCHKKFHSSCLYKWFVTSNKSTCPICRNLF